MPRYMNTQNYCLPSSENPTDTYCKTSQHPKKIGVCAVILQCHVVSLIFLKHTIITNVHCDIIQQFITLLECDEHTCIFQENDASAHIACETQMYRLLIPQTSLNTKQCDQLLRTRNCISIRRSWAKRIIMFSAFYVGGR